MRSLPPKLLASLMLISTALAQSDALSSKPMTVGLDGVAWSTTVQKLTTAQPDCQVERLDSGEAFLWHVRAVEGIRSKVTYMFHPRSGLSAVMIEPLGETEHNAESLNYSRPKTEAAATIVATLSAALDQHYEKRTIARTGPAFGMVAWQKKPFWARISHRESSDGLSDIRVYIEQQGDSSRTEAMWSRNFMWTRTKPGTWSKAGAFDVLWGMGPGDVRSVYPAATSGYGDTVTASISVRDKVDGEKALITFDFLRGRLVELTIMPSDPKESEQQILLGRRDAPAADKMQRATWLRLTAWGTGVREILTEKYGEPFSQPTKNDEAAAARLSRDLDYPVRWGWKTPETGVLYTQQFASHYLRYMERASFQEVNKLRRDEAAREEAARKAARKRRF